MATAQYMRERMELMQAMKESPSHLAKGECDYSPPLELVGIYVAHTAISRMVARGELKETAGAYLNAALGANAFAVLHHCTHESISQHNSEHEVFENVVFRLASFLIFFDDGYREAHRAHHARCNEPEDPDLLMSHTSLPVLGNLLSTMSQHGYYLGIGAPIGVRTVTALHHLGLTPLLRSTWLQEWSPLINWDNVAGKMLAFKAQDVLEQHKEYKDLHRTLQATWRGSTGVTYMILALFFGRYPHRNGARMVNEVDSFYDGTYRGQGQVDLWMMGEGPHDLHHAKSDVSYSRLPAVCRELEERRPELKVVARENEDLRTLEHKHMLPPKRTEASPVSLEFPSDRTALVLESKELLAHDPQQAVSGFAEAALQSALHCCCNADRDLLREVHKEMRLGRPKGNGHPLPAETWHETVFADETTAYLRAEGDRIKAEVASVARGVGARVAPMACDDDIKARYLDFFKALADEMVGPEQQALFLERLAASLPAPSADSSSAAETLRQVLEAPVPSNFMRKKMPKTYPANTRQRVANLVSGIRSRL